MRIPPDSQSHVLMAAWVKHHGNANISINTVEQVLREWCKRERAPYHSGLRMILWRALIANYSEGEEGDSIKLDANRVVCYQLIREALVRNNHRIFQLAEVHCKEVCVS